MQTDLRTEVYEAFTIRVFKTQDGWWRADITKTDGSLMKTVGGSFPSIPVQIDCTTVEEAFEKARRLIECGLSIAGQPGPNTAHDGQRARVASPSRDRAGQATHHRRPDQTSAPCSAADPFLLSPVNYRGLTTVEIAVPLLLFIVNYNAVPLR
jgi:hypothetical protein